MSLIRICIALGVALYVSLWVLALSGATQLITVLVVPLVLVAMVAGLNYLSSYLELPSKSPKFRDPHDEPK